MKFVGKLKRFAVDLVKFVVELVSPVFFCDLTKCLVSSFCFDDLISFPRMAKLKVSSINLNLSLF